MVMDEVCLLDATNSSIDKLPSYRKLMAILSVRSVVPQMRLFLDDYLFAFSPPGPPNARFLGF